jgi:hypothetical protein
MNQIAVTKPDIARMIEGIASTPSLDAHGQRVAAQSVTWSLPLALHHTHDADRVIGDVLAIWRLHDAVHFRAQIDDDAAWSEIVSGGLTGVSIALAESDGGYARVLKEISICKEAANPDAKIEIIGTIARSRAHDPSVEIRQLNGKVYHIPDAREEQEEPTPEPMYQAKLKQIESSVDDCRKIMLRDGVSHAEHTAAKSALEKLNAEHRRLLEVGMLAKAGIAPEPAKHQYADEVATEWDIEEIAEPREPDDWRDPELRLAYLRQLISFHTAAVAKSARDAGFSPRAFSSASDVVSLKGEISAYGFFQRGKFAALEKRLEEIENNATVFLGVHQRAISYKRGSLVSSAGGLWCAVSPAAQGQIPGKADCWQLAVKKGTFDD